MRAPIGRWIAGRVFVVWCWSERLSGSVVWARPSASDVDDLFAVVDGYHRGAVARDVVTDVSRIETVDPPAYASLVGHTRARRTFYVKHVRRHAMVRFAGLDLLAGLAEGFFPLVRPRHRWAVFSDAETALAWIGHPDASAVHREVERIVDEVRRMDPMRRRVRAFLKEHPSTATLSGAAHAVGVSERTLHRILSRVGTRFRDERAAVRIEEAQRLLGETEMKIDAVARCIGYSSHAHLTSVFRRATGETPAAYRTRSLPRKPSDSR